MADNPYFNKVVNGETGDVIIDLSSDTVTVGNLVTGFTAHDASGAPIVGTIDIPPEMTILSYGHSTWADFIAAYNTRTIVYCRASSNSNPASGSQTRMAFMAYVNNADSPTNVEFQYYRSVNQHSATQQGDQVYVYKLDKTAGWTVTVRESYTKIVAGTNMTSSYASGAITLNATSQLPAVSASDNGKVLKVVDGAWAVAEP